MKSRYQRTLRKVLPYHRLDAREDEGIERNAHQTQKEETMNPRPMRNDSDRVAPDRRIHLPGRNPVRSRRRIAAGVLSVLLGLSCFAASPAWAYKAGPNADDTPSPPEFANVPAYLADPDRHVYRDVKIGSYIRKRLDQVSVRQGVGLMERFQVPPLEDV